ncbi:hypothetical protein [Porphyromonas gulae]|uniref:hypothetical protein n=1 Tax=Porphyromonas gulae TaxID=111105 RepID=UPI000361AF45|nr:hypothetical protein [Porphyromonas gulae]
MKKVFLTMLIALSMGLTAVDAAEEKQSEVANLEGVGKLDSSERGILPPPPPGYVWIITTCRVYLVPTIYSPETLGNMALYYQSLCDLAELDPK